MGSNGNPGEILDACEVLEENFEEVDGTVSSLVSEHRRISIRDLLCEDMSEPYTQNLNNYEMVEQVLFELNNPAQYVPSLSGSDDCTGPLLPS